MINFTSYALGQKREHYVCLFI